MRPGTMTEDLPLRTHTKKTTNSGRKMSKSFKAPLAGVFLLLIFVYSSLMNFQIHF
jgi:hypothetical protein